MSNEIAAALIGLVATLLAAAIGVLATLRQGKGETPPAALPHPATSKPPQLTEPRPVVGNLTDLVDDVDPDKHLDVEVAVNANGKVVFFYNRPLRVQIVRVEFFVTDNHMVLLTERNARYYVGLPLSDDVNRMLPQAHEIVFVRVDEQGERVISQFTIPLVVYHGHDEYAKYVGNLSDFFENTDGSEMVNIQVGVNNIGEIHLWYSHPIKVHLKRIEYFLREKDLVFLAENGSRRSIGLPLKNDVAELIKGSGTISMVRVDVETLEIRSEFKLPLVVYQTDD